MAGASRVGALLSLGSGTQSRTALWVDFWLTSAGTHAVLLWTAAQWEAGQSNPELEPGDCKAGRARETHSQEGAVALLLPWHSHLTGQPRVTGDHLGLHTTLFLTTGAISRCRCPSRSRMEGENSPWSLKQKTKNEDRHQDAFSHLDVFIFKFFALFIFVEAMLPGMPPRLVWNSQHKRSEAGMTVKRFLAFLLCYLLVAFARPDVRVKAALSPAAGTHTQERSPIHSLLGNPQDTHQPVRTRRSDIIVGALPSLGGPGAAAGPAPSPGLSPTSAPCRPGPRGVGGPYPSRPSWSPGAPSLPPSPSPPSPRSGQRRAPLHTALSGPDLLRLQGGFPGGPAPPQSLAAARRVADTAGRGRDRSQALLWNQRTTPRERACALTLLGVRRRMRGGTAQDRHAQASYLRLRRIRRGEEATDCSRCRRVPDAQRGPEQGEGRRGSVGAGGGGVRPPYGGRRGKALRLPRWAKRLRRLRPSAPSSAGRPQPGTCEPPPQPPRRLPSCAPRHHAAALRTEPRGTGAPAGPAPGTAGWPRSPGRRRLRGEGTG
ncbi:hypothetical protein P7K49_002014 [Saguinus oedipus]|uniref:Uncharacterized protein n=1 Tax=Saguinus oedipus TaxID=9490 RepID=A0ABQ9WG52_SAGOE|nr:hypothetical protein P7K49_002014 [Saguinus oedipus]